jgi:hypothetical protein
VTLVASETLFQFTHFQQVSSADESRELSDERNVFRDVPSQFPKFWVLLDEPGHSHQWFAYGVKDETHLFMSATDSILLALDVADLLE